MHWLFGYFYWMQTILLPKARKLLILAIFKLEISHYYFYFNIYILLFPISCLHFSIFIGIIWRPHKHTRIYFVAQMHFRMWLSCIINPNIIYKYISSQKEVNKLSVILNEMARPRFHLWYLAAARASIFVIIFCYIFIIHLKYH